MAKKKKKGSQRGNAKRAAAKAKKPSRKNAEAVGGGAKSDAALLKDAKNKKIKRQTWKGVVEGDSIVGECLSYQKDVPSKHGEAVVLILGVDDGARVVYCNKSLEDGCDEAGVEPGDRVAIVFKGSVPTKRRGAPFKLYAVTAAKGSKSTRKRK